MERDTLAHYLLVVGVRDFAEPLHSKYQITKFNDIFAVPFKPQLLERVPRKDRSDVPLNTASVPSFCFPRGLYFARDGDLPAPTFHTFVMTAADANATRIHGAALVFYEPVYRPIDIEIGSLVDPPPERKGSSAGAGSGALSPARPQQRSLMPGVSAPAGSPSRGSALAGAAGTVRIPTGGAFVPKCLCVVSRHGMYNTFRSFLAQLLRLVKSKAPLPIERYIANFLGEVPLPPRGLVVVRHVLGDKILSISRSPANDFPPADFSFRPLFQALDCRNVALLFRCVLLERRVVLSSRRLQLAACVADALTYLMFPFRWHHLYIPVLPGDLDQFLSAPMPFIIGVHPFSIPPGPKPPHVVWADLDNNLVETPGAVPALPEPQGAALREALRQHAALFEPEHPELECIDYAYSRDSAFQPRPIRAFSAGLRPVAGTPLVPAEEPSLLRSFFSGGEAGGSVRAGGIPQHFPTGEGYYISPDSKGPVFPGHSESEGDGRGLNLPAVKRAFLHFFVSLLAPYRQFMRPARPAPKEGEEEESDGEDEEHFARRAFLAQHSPQAQPFLAQFLETQAWQEFVEERARGGADAHEAAFFDAHVAAHLESLGAASAFSLRPFARPFLADAEQFGFRGVHVTPDPDPSHVHPNEYFEYSRFPALQDSRLPGPRPGALPAWPPLPPAPAIRVPTLELARVPSPPPSSSSRSSSPAPSGRSFGEEALSALERVLEALGVGVGRDEKDERGPGDEEERGPPPLRSPASAPDLLHLPPRGPAGSPPPASPLPERTRPLSASHSSLGLSSSPRRPAPVPAAGSPHRAPLQLSLISPTASHAPRARSGAPPPALFSLAGPGPAPPAPPAPGRAGAGGQGEATRIQAAWRAYRVRRACEVHWAARCSASAVQAPSWRRLLGLQAACACRIQAALRRHLAGHVARVLVRQRVQVLLREGLVPGWAQASMPLIHRSRVFERHCTRPSWGSLVALKNELDTLRRYLVHLSPTAPGPAGIVRKERQHIAEVVRKCLTSTDIARLQSSLRVSTHSRKAGPLDAHAAIAERVWEDERSADDSARLVFLTGTYIALERGLVLGDTRSELMARYGVQGGTKRKRQLVRNLWNSNPAKTQRILAELGTRGFTVLD
eukprot:tig00001574_g9356.t1